MRRKRLSSRSYISNTSMRLTDSTALRDEKARDYLAVSNTP